jgi:hypothetical protein
LSEEVEQECAIEYGDACTKCAVCTHDELDISDTMNIGTVDGQEVFLRDQRYWFFSNPVNTPEESQTVYVITIPEGTQVDTGYAEVRACIAQLGYDPTVVCRAMKFYEVLGEEAPTDGGTTEA